MTSVTIYSKLFLEQEDDTWCARPNRELLEHLMRLDDTVARWILVIGGVRCALGDPVLGGAAEQTIYLPQWILDSAGFEGQGERVTVRFEKSYNLQKAGRLCIKVVGEIMESIDLKDLLEEPLTQLGVLQEGQIIPAPVLEGIHLIIKVCRPAGAEGEGAGPSGPMGPLLLEGAEVALEIEDDDAVIARREDARAATAQASIGQRAQAQAEPPDDSFSMIPAAQAAHQPQKFIPFQGQGRRLCD